MSHYDLDILQRDPLVVAPDDEFQKIVTQDLEDHADMSPIHTTDLEVVEELNTALAESIFLITLTNL